MGEIANNEALRRARRNEAWSYAGQAGGMEQGYNLANQGAVNAMTSQNLNVAHDSDMFNANLRNQDFGNQMQLMQMGMNAYSGLRQNPYGALVQGGAPINMGSIGGQSAVGVQDAMNMNNALTGMNVQNQQNKQNLWGNMANGFISNIGNG